GVSEVGSAVEVAGVEPATVGGQAVPAVVSPVADHRTGQREGHLRVVGRLAGGDAVGATGSELPDTVGVLLPDLPRFEELDERTEAVTDELAVPGAEGAVTKSHVLECTLGA